MIQPKVKIEESMLVGHFRDMFGRVVGTCSRHVGKMFGKLFGRFLSRFLGSFLGHFWNTFGRLQGSCWKFLGSF